MRSRKRRQDLNFPQEAVRMYDIIRDRVVSKTNFGHIDDQLNYNCSSGLLMSDLQTNYHSFAPNKTAVTNTGMAIQPVVTNEVISSGMQGAIAGEVTNNGGGRLPTGWTQSSCDQLEVLNLGEEAGLPFIDLHVVANNAGPTTKYPSVRCPSMDLNVISIYTASCFYKKLEGNWHGSSDVGQIVITDNQGKRYLALSRQNEVTKKTRLINNDIAITENSSVSFRLVLFNLSAGNSIDLTVRIYAPQLELGSYASAPVITGENISGTSTAVLLYDDVSGLNLTNGAFFIDFDWLADNGNIFGGEITPSMGQNKVCLSWQDTTLKIFLNGALEANTTLIAADMNLNELYFGNNGFDEQVNMTVKKAMLYDISLSDIHCTELTI